MNFNKNIYTKKYFSLIKFLKKEKCYLCHNIKKKQKIIPNLFNIISNKNNSKYKLYKSIRNGNKKNLKKNVLMPSFFNIKKKYLFFFIK